MTLARSIRYVVATFALVAFLLCHAGASEEADSAPTVVRGELVPHHSLTHPFIADWWQEGVPHWEVGGDTVVTDSFIRLTPQKSSYSGWLWNTHPNDNEHWELRIKFAVFGKRAPGADGVAFWYVAEPHRERNGPLFGNKDNFKGIGFVFDTYDNDGLRDNPSVSLISNLDGSKSSWRIEDDLREESTFRCQFDFRHTSVEEPVEALVQYHDKRLSLKLFIRRRHIEVNCGEVYIDLPIGYYFGATASTGGMVDNHDIISFELRTLGDNALDHRTPVEHYDEESDKRDKSFWGPQERKSGRQR